MDHPTSGQIRWGRHLKNLDENSLAVFRRATVGFVFQSFNLVPSMTALENVAFPMRFYGILPGRAGARITCSCGSDWKNSAHHRPTEMSGGHQQRVAIARALVNDPRLVLADEPTGNLDSGSDRSIMQLLCELHRDGRTVMVVTHDPRMARFATDFVRLLDGRIVDEAGAPRRPSSPAWRDSRPQPRTKYPFNLYEALPRKLHDREPTMKSTQTRFFFITLFLLVSLASSAVLTRPALATRPGPDHQP